MSRLLLGTIPHLVATKSQHRRIYQGVPEFLRQLREGAGLTQRDIGKLLDRPQSWVYNCEAGIRRVDVAEFCRWCRACNCDPACAIRQVEPTDSK